MQIKFNKPQTRTIEKALYAIVSGEGIDIEPAAMEIIAKNADGDMRAAVRNLESLALGQDRITVEMAEGLSKRDNKADMFALMASIFRSSNHSECLEIIHRTDEDPGTVQLWVDENLPYELSNSGDRVRGYEKMSRADIFLGRVYKRQYYGFWSYANQLQTMGVATSRLSESKNHDKLKFPSYLSKMSKSKSVRNLKKGVVEKIAVSLHTSTRRAELDILPFLKIMMKNDSELMSSLTESLSLEPAELAFLIGVKSDSKTVKTAVKEVESKKEERRIASQHIVREFPVTPLPSAEIVVPEQTSVNDAPVTSVPESEIPKTEAKPKGQMSLFDF